MKNWPHNLLLAHGDQQALVLLEQRYGREGEALVRHFAECRLAPIAVHRYRLAGLADAALAKALESYLPRGMAWGAQLQLAVQECAEFARQHDCEILLIKGAANARTLYEKQADRLGNDVDVVMRPADVERIWPGAIAHAGEHGRAVDHLDRTEEFTHLPLEIHYRWGTDGWGTADDLFADSATCDELPGLRLPSVVVGLTLTLTHLYKHRGVMPFDWLDLHLFCEQITDWHPLQQYWLQNDLAAQVLPGLLAARELQLPVPRDLVDQLRNTLPRAEKQIAEAMLSLFFACQWRRLRAERVEALIERQSLLSRCLPQVAGSPEITTRLTGLAPGEPGFQFQHYLAQPARRIYRHLRPQK